MSRPRDARHLAEPMTALEGLRGLVVIDEVQRAPELFPILRVLADRKPLPARFLVLGSASPELLKQSSETLAGRVAGAELDFVWKRGARLVGFEAKWGDAPTLTKSMRIATDDLALDALHVIYPGPKRYTLARKIDVVPLAEMSSLLP